jgi:ribosomal protein S18 acetylase RimI-like enzyme
MQILCSRLGRKDWNRLSKLLDSFCTRPDWILLRFEAETLVSALVLAAPNELNLPLEIIRLPSRPGKTGSHRHFELAVEKAIALGVRELYCTIPEGSADAFVISESRFRPWRKVVRFESAGPIGRGEQVFRSVAAGALLRNEVIALIEATSANCADYQIEYYRRSIGPTRDAEMTLQMMESTKYDPRWWRVALSPEGQAVGVILPVTAFGEPMLGFIGVLPEHRGQNIAPFLLAESWAIMKDQGFSTWCAEVDQQNFPMQRALIKSGFSQQAQAQEWRLEF